VPATDDVRIDANAVDDVDSINGDDGDDDDTKLVVDEIGMKHLEKER
jgi:hypothetical protein